MRDLNRSVSDDELSIQINVLETNREDDYNELQQKLGDIQSEFDDPFDVFQIVYNQAK